MSDTQKWAVWLHPIIRLESEPVPVMGTGSYSEMEQLFFDLSNDPNVDEFYLEFGPMEGAER